MSVWNNMKILSANTQNSHSFHPFLSNEKKKKKRFFLTTSFIVQGNKTDFNLTPFHVFSFFFRDHLFWPLPYTTTCTAFYFYFDPFTLYAFKMLLQMRLRIYDDNVSVMFSFSNCWHQHTKYSV